MHKWKKLFCLNLKHQMLALYGNSMISTLYHVGIKKNSPCPYFCEDNNSIYYSDECHLYLESRFCFPWSTDEVNVKGRDSNWSPDRKGIVYKLVLKIFKLFRTSISGCNIFTHFDVYLVRKSSAIFIFGIYGPLGKIKTLVGCSLVLNCNRISSVFYRTVATSIKYVILNYYFHNNWTAFWCTTGCVKFGVQLHVFKLLLFKFKWFLTMFDNSTHSPFPRMLVCI